MIIKTMRLATLLLLAVLTGCVNNTTVRQTHDWDEERKEIKNIVIIPDDIEVMQLTFTGDGDHLTEHEAAIRNYINNELPALFKARGIEAKLIDPALLQQSEVAYTLEQIDSSYESISKEIYRSAAMDVKQAHAMKQSIGEVAAPLNVLTGADAFLMVDFKGFEKSGGMIAKDAAVTMVVAIATLGSSVPIAPSASLSGHFTLIDAKDGEILWTNLSGAQMINAKVVAEAVMNGMPVTPEAAPAQLAAKGQEKPSKK